MGLVEKWMPRRLVIWRNKWVMAELLSEAITTRVLIWRILRKGAHCQKSSRRMNLSESLYRRSGRTWSCQSNISCLSSVSRISWGAAPICCKFVVKWRDIAGLFYYIRGCAPGTDAAPCGRVPPTEVKITFKHYLQTPQKKKTIIQSFFEQFSPRNFFKKWNWEKRKKEKLT